MNKQDLDNHITGHGGEDSVSDLPQLPEREVLAKALDALKALGVTPQQVHAFSIAMEYVEVAKSHEDDEGVTAASFLAMLIEDGEYNADLGDELAGLAATMAEEYGL